MAKRTDNAPLRTAFDDDDETATEVVPSDKTTAETIPSDETSVTAVPADQTRPMELHEAPPEPPPPVRRSAVRKAFVPEPEPRPSVVVRGKPPPPVNEPKVAPLPKAAPLPKTAPSPAPAPKPKPRETRDAIPQIVLGRPPGESSSKVASDQTRELPVFDDEATDAPVKGLDFSQTAPVPIPGTAAAVRAEPARDFSTTAPFTPSKAPDQSKEEKPKPAAGAFSRPTPEKADPAKASSTESVVPGLPAQPPHAKEGGAGFNQYLVAGLGLLVVGSLIYAFTSGGDRPREDELRRAYPYGYQGASGPRGEHAPGAAELKFTFKMVAPCPQTADPECLLYEYSKGEFVGRMLLRKSGQTWVRASDEGMPFLFVK